MEHTMYGALLVAWLLITPLIGAVVSASWGGATTALRRETGHGRAWQDNAAVPPDQVDYAMTSGETPRDSMRDREIRDRDGRRPARH